MHRTALTAALLGSTIFYLTAPLADVLAADAPTKVTVIAREKTIDVERALVSGDELSVPVDKVQAITGFDLKPQGMCAGDVCIAIPPDGGWVTKQDGVEYFNLTRFARKVDQAVTAEPEQKVWSFSEVPVAQVSPLAQGQAPDFALMDRDGKEVRLSDYRGKKVLLWTWASWCGCRFDLAGWEKIREDLKDKNFEFIAAAQDTGGPEIANPWYEKAHASFPALTDPNHTVSSLYKMVNVPSGVWIDESGKIVRPAEVAYSKQSKVLGQTIGDNRYVAGVRDWVEKGNKSPFVTPADKLAQKLAVPSSRERQADAEFKLATYLFTHGQRELALTHWQKSQELSPDNWNYHRQQWSFDKKSEMNNWLSKVRKLGDRPYYDPVEFPVPAIEEAK